MRERRTHLRTTSAGMPARIAVLEDDDALREDILVPGVAAHGFEVEGFARSGELYRRMLATSFDVVLLDIGLPEEDGLSVARHIGETTSAGIIVLTGRSDSGERIRGLEEAVDVWLRKPVEVEVIAASLHSLLRRLRPQSAGATAFAQAPASDWSLDATGWRLIAPGGRSVDLSRSERGVLLALQAARGEPVTSETLIAEIGERVDVFDKHRLEMLVHRLRRKVADATGLPLPVRSVRSRGYVWVG